MASTATWIGSCCSHEPIRALSFLGNFSHLFIPTSLFGAREGQCDSLCKCIVAVEMTREKENKMSKLCGEIIFEKNDDKLVLYL